MITFLTTDSILCIYKGQLFKDDEFPLHNITLL